MKSSKLKYFCLRIQKIFGFFLKCIFSIKEMLNLFGLTLNDIINSKQYDDFVTKIDIKLFHNMTLTIIN